VERWKWRFSDRQYKVAALAIAPSGIAVHGGWQSPFATETAGLFQTGNSVASAEQISAALQLSALICASIPYICVNHLNLDPVFSSPKQAPRPKATGIIYLTTAKNIQYIPQYHS